MITFFEENERQPSVFEQELAILINKHSRENGSNTPDYILAAFLNDMLHLFDNTMSVREEWYGRSLSPNDEWK